MYILRTSHYLIVGIVEQRSVLDLRCKFESVVPLRAPFGVTYM